MTNETCLCAECGQGGYAASEMVGGFCVWCAAGDGVESRPQGQVAS